MRATPGPWAVVLAGMVALAVAMGIGRFAFTPILPMMMAEGQVDVPAASWLASANYLGYLVGALLCTFQPWISRAMGRQPLVHATPLVRGGLVATALLTVAMAVQVPAAWPVLRFASGVASAVVFVYTSGWCLAQVARAGMPQLGGVMYTGPGVGIAISGLFASGMVAWHWKAATGWLIFGVLAAVLTASVWKVFQGDAAPAAAPVASAGPAPAGAAGEMGWLALAYGLAGFGYIITATFLPVIARQAIPGSAWLDLFWPIFGVGVVLGALISSRIPGRGDRRWLLVGCYVIQALGIAVGILSPTAPGFAIGSLLLGIPFTAITFFGMQEVRRLKPAQAPSYIGLLTALYGIGQIIGPPLAAAILARSATQAAGFTTSLEVAAVALLTGAAMYAAMVKLFPLPKNKT
ncbi:MAG: YbfB/YjiJ family MFS transporter [Burkholderiaceae bacterium]